MFVVWQIEKAGSLTSWLDSNSTSPRLVNHNCPVMTYAMRWQHQSEMTISEWHRHHQSFQLETEQRNDRCHCGEW